MAASIGTAWIQIKPSTQGISADIATALKTGVSGGSSDISKNLASVFDGVGKNVVSTLSSAFKKVADTTKGLFTAGLGGTIALFSAQMDSAFSRIDTLNNAPKMFRAMGYSIGDVNSAMGDLKQYVVGLPTSLDGAVRGVTGLSASFGGIKAGTQLFKSMNDAGLAFGASSAMIENAIMQLSQTSMDGPLDAATWNSLKNSGFEPVFQAMAKESGTTVAAMKKDFGGDGSKTVQDFINQLNKLDTEGGAGMQSLASMARMNTNGIATNFANMKTSITRSLAGVITTIPNFSQSIAGVGNAIEGTLTGKLNASQASQLINTFINGIATAVGTTLPRLLPLILSGLTTLVNDIASSLTKMLSDGKQTQTLIKGFVDLFVAVAKAYGQIILAIVPLIPQIIGDLAGSLADPKNAAPIAAALGILVGQSVAKTTIENTMKKLGDKMSDLFISGMSSGISKVGSLFKSVGASILEFAKKIDIIKIAQTAWNAILVVTTALQEALNIAMSANVFAIIVIAIAAVVAGLIWFFTQTKLGQEIFKNFAKIVGDVFKFIGDVIGNVIKFIVSVFNNIVAFFKEWGITILAILSWPISIWVGLFFTFKNQIFAVFTAIGQFIGTVFNFIYNAIIVPVFTVITAYINLVIGFWMAIFNGIITVVSFVFSTVWIIVSTIFNAVVGFIGGVFNTIFGIVGGIVGFFGSVFSQAWNAVVQFMSPIIGFFQGLWNQIVGIFTAVGTTVGNAVSSAFKSVVNVVFGFIGTLINGIIDGINTAIGVLNAIPGVHIGKLGKLDMPHLATGGWVTGSGTGTSDSVPAMLSNGEFVVKAAAAEKLGNANMQMINRGELPQSGNTVNIGDIVINGYNQDPNVLAKIISNKIAMAQKGVMA